MGKTQHLLAWAISPTNYVNASIANVNECLAKEGRKLPKKHTIALFATELGLSPELDSKDNSYYQSQIGMLR